MLEYFDEAFLGQVETVAHANDLTLMQAMEMCVQLGFFVLSAYTRDPKDDAHFDFRGSTIRTHIAQARTFLAKD